MSEPQPIRLVLVGASGRMGRQILRVLAEFPQLQLTGAVVSERSAAVGADAGLQAGALASGVVICASLPALLPSADLVLDFSSCSAAAANLAACVSSRVALLIGTTALPRELDGPLAAAAGSIPLLIAPNTSLGANVLLELVQRAARALPASFDIEVIESHHRHKRDAPSGTALALGGAAAQGRGASLAECACYARTTESGERKAGQIGFAVVRGGDVIGDHQVQFLGEGERLVLAHSATDRAVFARGALRAGIWLAQQPPGRHTIREFIFGKQ